ncbi:MAG: hypothetical protein SGPRY_006485 [Prymnesium sp.]
MLCRSSLLHSQLCGLGARSFSSLTSSLRGSLLSPRQAFHAGPSKPLLALRKLSPSSLSTSLARYFSSTTEGTSINAVSRWSLRLAHDNTFLSYHRNAIIATVAGTAMVQYRKGEGRPPLAAAGLLAMGGLYMYIGSVLYVTQTLVLRRTLELGVASVSWAIFNASWPIALWTISLVCMLDETPGWLLDSLCLVQGFFPKSLHGTFFLETCQLHPIVRILHTIRAHEERRLRTVQPQGLTLQTKHTTDKHAIEFAKIINERNHVVRRRQSGTVLTNQDYITIITLRLERFAAIEAKLAPLADISKEYVPTATVMPILDRLYAAVSQLEIALEADILWLEKEKYRGYGVRKYFAKWFSLAPVQQRMLREELEAVTALKRRCAAVKTESERLLD